MIENNEAGFPKTHSYIKAMIKLPETVQIHFFLRTLECNQHNNHGRAKWRKKLLHISKMTVWLFNYLSNIH